jgi:hypothetical protein
MLDDLLVASPCRADWDQMTGDDRVRTCAACSKRVFNLSALTRAEAEALVAANRGADWCGRYYQRLDGTIVLADCLVRGSGAGARKLALAAALVAGTACVHPAPPPMSNVAPAHAATWALRVDVKPPTGSDETAELIELFTINSAATFSFGGAMRDLSYEHRR